MSKLEEISYTRDELRSYLPSGWSLVDPFGLWDGAKGTYSFRVLDDVDFQWPVTVKAAESEVEGRMEALRRAFDRSYRERLGRPTRGLGLSRSG